MKFIQGDKHDKLSAIYQSLEVGRLDEALRENGIEDDELIRRVCETYFFKSGYFFDACWFEIDEVRYRPGLSFEAIGLDNGSAGRVYLADADEGTLLHEYASQSASWYFDLDFEEDDNLPPDVEEGDMNHDYGDTP